MRVVVLLLAVVVVAGMVDGSTSLRDKLMRLNERMERRKAGPGGSDKNGGTKRRWRFFKMYVSFLAVR